MNTDSGPALLDNPPVEIVNPLVTVAKIAGHPFLKGMSQAHLEILANCAMQKQFAAGELIFREGDPANRFYLIQNGHVALETEVEDRGMIPIQTLGAGEVLGWSWLFPPYYWHFSARALEPADAIFFYGTRLRDQCESEAALGQQLVRRMAAVASHRLQATRRRLVEAQFS